MRIIVILFMFILFLNINSQQIEKYTIPNYNNDLPIDQFDDIGIDGETGSLCLCGPNIWCEIPINNKEPDYTTSFSAATKGFRIIASTYRNGGVCVYDSIRGTILDEDGEYTMTMNTNIENVSGITAFGYQLLIASINGTIYSFENTDRELLFIKEKELNINITGITADEFNIYICGDNHIYKLNQKCEIIDTFNFDISFNGIEKHDDIIWAIGLGENKFYKIKGI